MRLLPAFSIVIPVAVGTKAENAKRRESRPAMSPHPHRMTTAIQTSEMTSAIHKLASVKPTHARLM